MVRILREGEKNPEGALEVGDQDVISESTIQHLNELRSGIEKLDYVEMFDFLENSIKELLAKQKKSGCTRAEKEFAIDELKKIVEFVSQKGKEKMEKDLADIDNLFADL